MDGRLVDDSRHTGSSMENPGRGKPDQENGTGRSPDAAKEGKWPGKGGQGQDMGGQYVRRMVPLRCVRGFHRHLRLRHRRPHLSLRTVHRSGIGGEQPSSLRGGLGREADTVRQRNILSQLRTVRDRLPGNARPPHRADAPAGQYRLCLAGNRESFFLGLRQDQREAVRLESGRAPVRGFHAGFYFSLGRYRALARTTCERLLADPFGFAGREPVLDFIGRVPVQD